MTSATIDCPRCGKPVVAKEDWCLNCGFAARTSVVRSSDWRKPVAVLATLIALSLAAMAIAFVQLTDDPAKPSITPQLQTTPAPTTTTTNKTP